MHEETDIKLREIIKQEFLKQFEEELNQTRIRAKEQILKVQSENCGSYNLKKGEKKRRTKRTQLGPGRKLRAKYLGRYRIIKVESNDSDPGGVDGSRAWRTQLSACTGAHWTWLLW